MDEHTFNNWVKVKRELEQSGKTNNYFYSRACQIVRSGGRIDPEFPLKNNS